MNKGYENEDILSVFCMFHKELNIYKYCPHSRYS